MTDVLDDAIERKHLTKFVEVYQSCPELWDPRHEHYANKYRRIQAQEKLLEVYKQIRPNATRVDVRMKINSMRSNYNKIIGKVKAAAAEGTKYVPTNWMFHKLRFLEATKMPKRIKSTEDEEVCNDETESHDISIESPGTPTMATEYVEIDENPQESFIYQSSASESKKPNVSDIKIQKRKIQKRRKQDIQTHRSAHSIQLHNLSTTANIEPIALVWSSKLQALEPKQRLLAEKAINDILFEASMKTLRSGRSSQSAVGGYSTETFVLETPEEYVEYDSTGEEDEN